MLVRQRIVTFGIPTTAIATVVLAALLGPRADEAPPPDPAAAAMIDVVFAVDTTSSMGGLLDGAKRTVWSIASQIRSSHPGAELRFGLVAYRDIGDDYVTRPFALTDDLDAVNAELMSYRAEQGGDIQENVDAALDVALHGMAWRQSAKKLVFLVGDAQPATRGEVPSFEASAREAADRGIAINTIRCGHNPDALVAFQRIAALAGGEFSSISQDGGVQQVATAYDAEIAALSDELEDTAVIGGSDAYRREHAWKTGVARGAAPATKADRAGYFAKGGRRAAGDLVASYAEGTIDVATIPADALPSDLRTKDRAALRAELERRVAARKQLEARVKELTAQRERELARRPAAPDAFDISVKATLERQLD